jgi:tRNA threonylcarbamoyladenosine biosynthesis protein TsaE
MNCPLNIVVNSEEETINLAKNFAALLNVGDIVLLNGDLGTGKTFFVKNICSVYGIENVSSPSFTLVNEYNNSKKIFHIDFYRIKKVEELYNIGIDEYLNDNEAIIFIEWSDLYKEVVPKYNYKINLKYFNNSSREINILRNE